MSNQVISFIEQEKVGIIQENEDNSNFLVLWHLDDWTEMAFCTKERSTEQSYRSIMGYRSGNQNCGKSCAEYRQVAPNRKPLLPVELCGHEKNWAWLDLLRYVPMTMLLPGMPSENAGWPSPNTHPIEKTENHQIGCHWLTSHNNKNIIYLTFYIKFNLSS